MPDRPCSERRVRIGRSPGLAVTLLEGPGQELDGLIFQAAAPDPGAWVFLRGSGQDASSGVQRDAGLRLLQQTAIDILLRVGQLALPSQHNRPETPGVHEQGMPRQSLIKASYRLTRLSLLHEQHGLAVQRLRVVRLLAQYLHEGFAGRIGQALVHSETVAQQ